MVDPDKLLRGIRAALREDLERKLPALNKKRFHHTFAIRDTADGLSVRITNWEGRPPGWIRYVAPEITEQDVAL